MLFISDTNEHELETNVIEVIENCVFTSLTTPALTLHEGATPLAGTTFYAGYVIPIYITKLKLASGAILVK